MTAKICRICLSTIVLALVSCATRKVFDQKTNPEVKPPTKLNQDISNLQEDPIKEMFEATYLLRIRTEKGNDLCEGTASLIGYTNFFVKQSGEATCKLGIKVDMSKMMKGSAEYVPATKDEAKLLPNYGRVSRVKKLGSTTFNPPRAFVLGPVIQNVKSYTGFQMIENLEVTQVDDQGVTRKATGVLTMRALEAGINFQPEGYAEVFPDVLHWEYTTVGFQGLNRSSANLYDRFEYYWSTKPIAIPMIRITGNVSNFVESGFISKLGSLIVGQLTVELILRKHTQI